MNMDTIINTITNKDIFRIILITEQDDYYNFNSIAKSLNNNISICKKNSYRINKDSEYYSLELEISSKKLNQKEVILYLLKQLHFICFRVESLKNVFIKDYGDFMDLYLDEYDFFNGDNLLKKDLLSLNERLDIIKRTFQNNFNKWDHIFFLEYINKEDFFYYPIKNYISKIYQTDFIYNVMSGKTKKIITINLTSIIKDIFFTFLILKKLEK